MKIILLILFSLIPSILGTFTQIEDCLYIDEVKVHSNSSSIMSSSAVHQFQLSWSSPQNNITASSYTLMGYKVENSNAIFGFSANLSNITGTNGILNVLPIPNSAISYLQFSIILLKASTVDFTLKFLSITPTVFTAGRTLYDSQYINIVLDKAFTSNTQNYYAQAFISSFAVQSFAQRQLLSISIDPIHPGSNHHTIILYSHSIYQNVYSNICLTYILFYIPSFNYRINYLSDSVQIYRTPSSPGLNFIPMANPTNEADNYLPPFQKCIFGLLKSSLTESTTNVQTYFDLYFDGTRGLFIVRIQYSTSTYTQFKEGGLCLGTCPLGSYMDPQGTAYQCNPCNVPNCTSCRPNGTCDTCLANFFLLQSNQTCLIACPSGYNSDSITMVCYLCLPQCVSCSNYSTCTTCKTGWPVDGGCTSDVGCTRASGPACVQCKSNQHFQFNGRVCNCSFPYFMVTNVCINNTGCIVAKRVNNQSLCYACNRTLYFVLAKNVCECRDGYELSGSKCTEKCGDGRLFVLDCDDGNKIDGDGCSSNCKIENKYKCARGSFSTPSVCQYQRSDITIAPVLIDRADTMNRAKLVFAFSPNLLSLGKNNFSQSVSFNSSMNTSVNNISFVGGKLIILLDFYQDIQGSNASISFSFDKKVFLQANANVSFKLVSMGERLFFQTSQPKSVYFYKYILIVLSAFALLIFLMSSFVEKMVGLELLHTFQVIYFTHFTTNYYTHTYGFLRYLSFSAWNFLGISDGLTHVDSVSHHIEFSIKSQLFTKMVIFALSIILCVILILKKCLSKNNETPKLNKKGKIINRPISYKLQTAFQALINLHLGCIMTLLLITSTTDIQSQHTLAWATYSSVFLMMSASFIFLREFKEYRTNDTSPTQKATSPNQKQYDLAYLGIILATAFIISLNYHYKNIMAVYPLLTIQTIFLVLIIKDRPYESFIDNLGVFLNRLAVYYFLIWSIIREYLSRLLSQQVQIWGLAVLLVLLFGISLLVLVRIVYEIKKRANENHKEIYYYDQALRKRRQNEEARYGWMIYHKNIKEKEKPSFASKIVADFHQGRLMNKEIMQIQKKAFLLNEGLA